MQSTLFAIRALETACVEVHSGSTARQGDLSALSSLMLDACRPQLELEVASYNSSISACEKGQLGKRRGGARPARRG